MDIGIPDGVFAAVRAHFDERETVELTAAIGGYNLVSRFLEAATMRHETGELKAHNRGDPDARQEHPDRRAPISASRRCA